MIKTVTDVWRKRAVAWHFVQVLLTTSYRTKSLGFLWALLDPLFFMLVYYLVFAVIIAHRKPWFMLHIYIGVISFRFLSASVSQSAQMLKGQAGIIREIAFPKAVLPVAVVATRFFDYVVGWIAAIGIAFIFHVPPDGLWLLIPVLIVIQLIFVMGLCFLTAYVGVYFADVLNFIDVGMRLWFYMSPILYLLNEVFEKTHGRRYLWHLYLVNPMTSMIQTYEYVVFWHRPAMMDQLRELYPHLRPDVFQHLFLHPGTFVFRSLLEAVIMLLIGLYVFSRAEGQLAKYV